MAEQLDIKKELSALQDLYNSHPKKDSFKCMLSGGTGSGKTYSLLTARKPVLLDSFDPDGWVSIRDQINKGIYVDSRFETDDPKDPTAFAAWEKEHFRRKAGGLYTHIGTLAIDSMTTWTALAMNVTLKRKGRPGGTPQQDDYLPTMIAIENAIKDILSLPCDVIFITHKETDKDEATGRMFTKPLLLGKKGREKIPILFSEVYFAITKETSKGTEYSFLTQATGMYEARTRLGSNGRFEMYEKPDFMYLRKKAGLSAEHLPY